MRTTRRICPTADLRTVLRDANHGALLTASGTPSFDGDLRRDTAPPAARESRPQLLHLGGVTSSVTGSARRDAGTVAAAFHRPRAMSWTWIEHATFPVRVSRCPSADARSRAFVPICY